MKLTQSLRAWNTGDFIDILKLEISALDAELLPLQEGLSQSSHANADNLSASILKIDESDDSIIVKAGLFYTGIIAGCNCADDPTPVDENNEYCEVVFKINKTSAETTVNIVDR